VKILITGAGGMLGKDVTRDAHGRGHEVIALARPALDITDPRAVDDTFHRYRPEAVINCAAWTDVDGAESDEHGAMWVNNHGAALVAGTAAAIGAKVVHPSSDYVFDGSAREPYVESDVPHPISAYGRSKQAGETAVTVANSEHFVVRSSWLFGTAGPNFVETMLRIAGEQNEVIVVSDQVGSPTYTVHLARALVTLAEGDAYGIHHIAGGGSCSWYEFAQEIYDQEGIECRVMSATTDMVPRPAPRPPFSVLRSERDEEIELPNWRKGLAEYLAERRRNEATAAEAAA
jgi:dTDP-4-dehydrorhamnose reductase